MRRNFGDELAGHGFAECMKIVDFLHEAAWPAGYILPIVLGQSARRLYVSKGPRDRVIVDDCQAVDDDASLYCIVACVGNLSSSIVGPIAAHVDYVSRSLVAAFGDQLHGPIHARADRGAPPERPWGGSQPRCEILRRRPIAYDTPVQDRANLIAAGEFNIRHRD